MKELFEEWKQCNGILGEWQDWTEDDFMRWGKFVAEHVFDKARGTEIEVSELQGVYHKKKYPTKKDLIKEL